MLFPDYFEEYREAIPVEERGDMMKAYYKRLTGDDEEEKLKWYNFTVITKMIIANTF